MTFDLSLAEVKASKEYDKTVDGKTGEVKDKTVTDGGVRIDKSRAPKIIADGPLGYKYTELLNQTLTNENMSAIVAAAEDADEGVADRPVGETGLPTGYVAVGDGHVVNEIDTTDIGYVYVVDAGDVKTADMMQIASDVLSVKNQYPDRPIAVGVIDSGRVSDAGAQVVEALLKADIAVAVTQEGFLRMVKAMAVKMKG